MKYLSSKLRIACDIDQVLADFESAYNKYYNTDISKENNYYITKNVYKLRRNKEFWTNLEVIDRPNFIPYIYATKRINLKSYTREWLLKNKFPDRPIYQTIYQYGNKADIIKGYCDVLIDDSVSNVYKCIKSGVPALLIDRPHNRSAGPEFRIYNLDIDEIREGYEIICKYYK
jgi:5'(3')-deoxyribonucleotidase